MLVSLAHLLLAVSPGCPFSCEVPGVSCNGNDSPTAVRIFAPTERWKYSPARGNLPTELGLCTDLEEFSFAPSNASYPLWWRDSMMQKQWKWPKLSGTLPTQLSRLHNLQRINIFKSAVSGTLPTEIGALPSIRSLQMDWTHISGTIPTEIGLASSSLTELSIEGEASKYSGTLPTQIANLGKLDQFYAGQNALSGTLPPEYGRLNELSWGEFFLNRFSGTIPQQWGGMSAIGSLFIGVDDTVGSGSDTRISGTIPQSFETLEHLVILSVHNIHALSGSVPSAIAAQPYLPRLEIYGTRVKQPTKYQMSTADLVDWIREHECNFCGKYSWRSLKLNGNKCPSSCAYGKIGRLWDPWGARIGPTTMVDEFENVSVDASGSVANMSL
jgi:hypothetical protein